jgi:y4mF family transcriptional regulator
MTKAQLVPLQKLTDMVPASTGGDLPTKIASMNDLGGLVKAARLARKLSQQEFADQAGVGRRFVSELENGKATLQFDKVIAVAASVGIELFVRER